MLSNPLLRAVSVALWGTNILLGSMGIMALYASFRVPHMALNAIMLVIVAMLFDYASRLAAPGGH